MGKPKAWIIDIDGTLAIKGERHPFDWNRVGEDAPNSPVICVVQALTASTLHSPPGGYAIVYVSGRMEQCREATRDWLHDHVCGSHLTCICGSELHMRPDDDFRPDDVLKREIYEDRIRDRYEVVGVLDDRDKVVKGWRAMGLTCLQVAEGNF